MVTYSELRGDRERCLALTSLTPAEFDFLLPAFVRAYQRRSPAERRRQRPKKPEKQAAHYSGRKKIHSDKNVVVVDAGSRRVGFLSRTCAGRAADKGIADRERITYPPGTVLHKDSGFQGYEPEGVKTRQAKKKAARWRVDGC